MAEKTVRWPFYKYEALIPEHIPADLFEWLYLSLLVHINIQTGKLKESYGAEEKDLVKRLIKEKFARVIDEITLEKIIGYVEKDYVIRDRTQSEVQKTLDDKAFRLLDSFDNLFSSNLQVRHIFQDAITGEVVPIFEEMPYLKDCKEKDYEYLPREDSVKKPTPKRIKAAYKSYLKLLQRTTDESESFDDLTFEDPDMEINFDSSGEMNSADLDTPQIDPENFTILFYGERILLNLKVEILIENGEFRVKTPFDYEKTSRWMNNCFKKACDISPRLKALREEIGKQLKGDNQLNASKEIVYPKNVADQLDVCGAVYRLLSSAHVPDTTIKDDLEKMLVRIDKYFAGKHYGYFVEIGNYLECLIYPLIDYSDKDKRPSTKEHFFKLNIETICRKLNLKYSFLMGGGDIFSAWQKARKHYKADIVNVIIANPKFLKCASLYYEFIKDAFDLYNLRTKRGHYEKAQSSSYEDFKQEHIDKLYRVTKVFLDLY